MGATRSILSIVLAAAACVLPAGTSAGEEPAGSARAASPPPAADGRVPLIYCTDLFHPHEDPDDHFDLATIYALPGLDLKGIVLDQGDRQARQPGRIPVSQLNLLSRRDVPCFPGLGRKLESPTDQALGGSPEHGAGVRFILDTLRRSPVPAAVITVGSVRDLTAAFNREPALCRERIAVVLCFIGEASKEDFREYNVGLDPHAYVGLMRSGLRVRWVPCFDGGPWENRGHASFWKARHRDLLGGAPEELVRYFIYALDKASSDPLAFLSAPADPARRAALLGGERNLWCTAVFAAAAGEVVAFDGKGYGLRPAATAGGGEGALFGFDEVEVTITDSGVVKYGPAPGARKVERFAVRDPARYAEGMTRATAALLARFPVAGPR